MRLDRLAQLDLLVVPLLGVQLGPQTPEVLRILALLVAFTGGLLAGPLLVVEAATMLLDGALDVFVLRLEVGEGWSVRSFMKGFPLGNPRRTRT